MAQLYYCTTQGSQSMNPEDGHQAFRCRKSDGTITQICMKYYKVNCGQIYQELCNTNSGAWVAATTVCSQSLWT
jgi:hypothetical protein